MVSWCADFNSTTSIQTFHGKRTCEAAGPRLWNSLPVQLRNPDITYELFRRQLKRHLFRNHGHGALWLLICSALEKHLLTYLLTYSNILNYGSKRRKQEPSEHCSTTDHLWAYIKVPHLNFQCSNCKCFQNNELLCAHSNWCCPQVLVLRVSGLGLVPGMRPEASRPRPQPSSRDHWNWPLDVLGPIFNGLETYNIPVLHNEMVLFTCTKNFLYSVQQVTLF